MSFINHAWELQNKIEPKIKNWLFKKIGIRFFVAMVAISFLGYAIMIWIYFIIVEPVDLFTTGRIPSYLNPIHIIFVCGIVFLILILEKKETLM